MKNKDEEVKVFKGAVGGADSKKSEEAWGRTTSKAEEYKKIMDDKKKAEMKSQICRFLLMNGSCRFGDKCFYSHDIALPDSSHLRGGRGGFRGGFRGESRGGIRGGFGEGSLAGSWGGFRGSSARRGRGGFTMVAVDDDDIRAPIASTGRDRSDSPIVRRPMRTKKPAVEETKKKPVEKNLDRFEQNGSDNEQSDEEVKESLDLFEERLK